MSDTPENFNWADVHECIVQQSVERVAIYSNPHDDIVIRQERAWNEEEDTFIVIARAHALTAAYAILEAAGHGDICFHRACGGGFEDVDVPIRPGVAAMMASRPDINWKAVNEGFNEGETDVSEQKPKDPTAAERMRRYRNRHRNDDRNAVTDEPELQLVNGADQQQEALHAAE